MSQQTLAPWQRGLVLGMQRFIYWLSKHWLALVNVFALVYVTLPFSAPVFMKAGWTGAARVVYTIYDPLCHQLAFRSWFLFGEQPVYPRDEYVERLGLGGMERAQQFAEAEDFVGNEALGYKVALCQRDVAIHAAIFVGGVVYALLRRRGLGAMPFWLFILIGIVPVGLDGGSQLVSLLVTAFPDRESVWQLRTLTGVLFGFSVVWLAYPYIQEGMDETRQILAARYGWDGYAQPLEPSAQTTHDQVVQLLKDQDVI
jgi:uncharacterized membrane protein